MNDCGASIRTRLTYFMGTEQK